VKAAVLLAWLATALLLRAAPIPAELVDVSTIRPPLLEEIRYATKYNFTGEQLYPFPAAYVHRDVAAALAAVQADLAREGLGLKIYDGYRPLSVQQKMWDLIRDERYVSNPAVNKGRHTRGTAVDVTLVDKHGNELPMPSPFDDFTEAAHRDSPTMAPAQHANMQKLQDVMVRHGFEPYPFEWWHYDFHDWKSYPVLDISFDDLARGVKTTEPAK
jgi:D-alanyl-D-alanine dipeptidase